MKIFKCSFCQNILNSESLDYYYSKYKEQLYKHHKENLSMDLTKMNGNLNNDDNYCQPLKKGSLMSLNIKRL